MNGLIVKGKWLELIFRGAKTWEIRGHNTKARGTIALIKSGTGMVYGTVDIIDSIPVGYKELSDNLQKHQIPYSMLFDIKYKHPHAWVLKNQEKFEKPIPYIHPPGAVIWVKLHNKALFSYKLKEGFSYDEIT